MKPVEHHMERIMSSYWINFTKTGNPNADILPFWSEYKEGESTVMVMRNGFFLDKIPDQVRMDFFEEFFRNKR